MAQRRFLPFRRSVSFVDSVSSGAVVAAEPPGGREGHVEVAMRAKRRSPVRAISGPLVTSTTSIGEDEEQLPYGWERVEDEDFGVFYIE